VRLAVVTEQLLARVPGGTGRYTGELLTALAASRPAGTTLTTWTAWHRDLRAAAPPPGASWPRRLPLPAPLLARAWGAGRGPSPRAADAVLAPTLLVPPRRQAALAVVVHDAVPWTHPETLTPHGQRWHRVMGQRVAREADAVLGPTRAVAADLAAALPDLDPGRVHVTGGGASEAVTRRPPDAAQRAARLRLPPSYLLTVATLEPRKGLDVALAALADPAAPDLPLLLAGQPGWGGLDPVAEARRLGLAEGRVRVLGRLSDADLAVVLGRAAVLLVPSRSEGFGLPVAEGLAAGVPVVVSDAPALVEVAGGTAEVVPREDPAALAAAAARVVGEDEAARGRRRERGRRQAGEHTWGRVAVRTWAVLDMLTGPGERGVPAYPGQS